jgi:hypothetical protein
MFVETDSFTLDWSSATIGIQHDPVIRGAPSLNLIANKEIRNRNY